MNIDHLKDQIIILPDIKSCFLFEFQGSDESPPVVVYVSGKAGLPETEYTWAKLLRDNG